MFWLIKSWHLFDSIVRYLNTKSKKFGDKKIMYCNRIYFFKQIHKKKHFLIFLSK